MIIVVQSINAVVLTQTVLVKQTATLFGAKTWLTALKQHDVLQPSVVSQATGKVTTETEHTVFRACMSANETTFQPAAAAAAAMAAAGSS